MLYSEFFLTTMKEEPAEAELVSHKLMLRAGMIKKLAAGIYNFLPLGLRVLRKVENIIREEMDKSGAQEVLLPVLSPARLWRESGRWDAYGAEMMRIRDRHDREFCLGPTHEEVITDLARRQVHSYRQLPVNLYQIQTKFRDEIRPRFGLMRGREFLMKDGYSFDRDEAGAEETYRGMYDAYRRIFERCGLLFKAVEADTGAIGGSFSHEFMVLASSGEEGVVFCERCSYAANPSRARCQPPPPKESSFPMAKEEVHTPGLKSVEAVSAFLNTRPHNLLKTLIVQADDKHVAVLLQGNHELNAEKLKKVLGCEEVRMADARTVQEITGAPVGFASPVGLKGPSILADLAVERMTNFVTGANMEDYHLVNVNWGRDFFIDRFLDLRNITEEDHCPDCGGQLRLRRGIEVGHIFKLGTKYSQALNASYLDESGESRPMVMGCYGIGVGRTAAASIEQNHDENGIIWPIAIAPFQVHILPLDVKDGGVMELAQSTYRALEKEGYEVLLDDRDERPGSKFKDADLLGIPLRINIGLRDLKKGLAEIKLRKSGQSLKVKSEEVLETALKLLPELP